MHKYWARKPFNVVREYIDHYSEEEEIVLDPFLGSGVTAIEAVKIGRRAVGIDLNPLSIFITRTTLENAELDDFEQAFKELEMNVKKHINGFYQVTCPKCKSEALISCTYWSYVVKCPNCEKRVIMSNAKRQRGKRQNIYICYHCKEPFSYADLEVIDEIPLEIVFSCQKCGKQRENTSNIETVSQDHSDELESHFIPDLDLRYPSGKNFRTKRRGKNIHDLFTSRNLLAVSILYEKIVEMDVKPEIRDLMMMTFSSMLPQTTRMMIWTESSGASWKIPEYLIFARHCEFNVWSRFENRFNAVYRGKEEALEETDKYVEAKEFENLINGTNVFLSQQSALDLSNIPSSYIDYVFTDPPYGGAIQYYELDKLYLAWLSKYLDTRLDWWKDEITMNKAQGKDFNFYHNMLCKAFSEIFRVLKPGRWMTVTFHSTDIEIYNSIIRACILAGFQLEQINYQTTSTVSVKAQAQPYGSAIGDYYIRFYKAPAGTQRKLYVEREVDKQQYERVVVEVVKRIIAQRGEPTTYTDLLTRIYIELDKHGFLLISKPEHIQSIIQKHEGKEFVFLMGQGWWFKEPEKYWLDILPLDERLETAIIQVLRRENIISFDDVLKEIFLTFRNALTPSEVSILRILEEYAEKIPKTKKWRFKSIVRKREHEHSRIIGCLAEIGRMAGFDIWIGQREQGEIYNKNPLSELCDFEKLSLSRVTPSIVDDHLKQIDVLWIQNNEIAYAFEVEYTTAITEAFNRCSNIPEEYQAKKFIVIPRERESLLSRKINSELLKERVEKEQWRFIFFDDLDRFYEMNKGEKKIEFKEFEGISKTPLEEREKQGTIDQFTN
jgi:DNA modification methylase